MYIDKIIKKEVITLITSVGLLLIIFIGVSFASFFKIDEGENNVVQTGDLAISFCSDLDCDNTYQNMGQTIGVTKQDGSTIPESIFPYPNDGSYSNTTPYIFKVENTGSIEATITIKLNEDTDFLPTGDYSEFKRLTDLYGSHLKIAIRKRVLATGSEYQMGDVNMDGIVNKNDSDLIRKAAVFAAELTDEQIELADINGDGKANTLDALAIDNTLIGKDTDLEKTYISSFSDLENGIIYTNDKLDSEESAIYFLWLYLDNTTPNQAQSTYFVGNLDIQGEFLPENLPASFANASWTEIIQNVKTGNTDTYNIGDTKEIDLGDLGKHRVRIANKSTPTECDDEDFDQTACGFILEFTDIISKVAQTQTNASNLYLQDMAIYLNATVYKAIPSEIKSGIKGINVKSYYDTKSEYATSPSNFYLFLLSPAEIYSGTTWDAFRTRESSRQLDYYKNMSGTNSSAIKKYNGVASIWWTRTINSANSTLYAINTDGNPSNSEVLTATTKEYGISPAFRIG